MAQHTDTFDIARLGLTSGEGRRLDLVVSVDPLQFGGQSYAAEGGAVDALLDVSHTVAGYSLRLRYATGLRGPCMRCLEDARAELEIDSREVDQPGGGEDLTSPYLEDGVLDLRAWARDALVLALPVQIVCREDCLGLCSVCGQNLNEAGPGHAHESEPDPRWAKLSEIEFD
jgi:uncharacterized protein